MAKYFLRNGLRDWIIQRLTAWILLSYFLWLGYWVFSHPANYSVWFALFQSPVIKCFSTTALMALIAHAWIGIWTVSTDYLNHRALGQWSLPVRSVVLILFVAALWFYLLWGLFIIWRA